MHIPPQLAKITIIDILDCVIVLLLSVNIFSDWKFKKDLSSHPAISAKLKNPRKNFGNIHETNLIKVFKMTKYQ